MNNWRLKSEIKICSYCNTTRTQPFDRAWEDLSTALFSRASNLKVGDIVKVNKIFNWNTRQKMLNVHLYFVKLLGCRISSASIPIDIEAFSESLIRNKAHPDVYLRLGVDRLSTKAQGASISEVSSQNDKDDRTIAASMAYQIGGLVVIVMYVRAGFSCVGLQDAWHPKSSNNNFKVVDCFYAESD